MSIKTKLSWLLILWTIVILAIANTAIYISYVKLTEDRELDTLEEISEGLLKTDLDTLTAASMKPFLRTVMPDDGMIRIIEDGRAVITVADEEDAAEFPPSNSITSEQSKIQRIDGKRVAVYAVPLSEQDPHAGILEISKNLEDLNEDMDTLLVTMLIVSFFLLLACAFIGKVVASRFLHPVTVIGSTMDRIQQEGRFQKIDLPERKRDELVQLGANFNRMIESLEEVFTRQEQFLSDASHELKTPLTVIENYASMLGRWGKDDPALLNEGIETIQDESKRMKRLVEQLLDIAAIQKQPFERSTVNVTKLCEQTAKRLETAKNRTIDVSSDPATVFAFAHEEKLIQILFILLDNALKYSAGTIRVQIQGNQAQAVIQVIDRGSGIPAADIPHLFERFYRVDPSRTRATGGTGLGLAIAKELVEKSGGTIQIESEPGIGTTATVTLEATAQQTDS